MILIPAKRVSDQAHQPDDDPVIGTTHTLVGSDASMVGAIKLTRKFRKWLIRD